MNNKRNLQFSVSTASISHVILQTYGFSFDESQYSLKGESSPTATNLPGLEDSLKNLKHSLGIADHFFFAFNRLSNLF